MNIKNFRKIHFLIITLLFFAASCGAQEEKSNPEEKTKKANTQTTDMKDHSGHNDHFEKVNEQGDKTMGFSHKKTKHTFRLLEDGGAIEVRVNDPSDEESLIKVRSHLREITTEFPAGNFDAPFMTHGKMPPGVPVMQRLSKEINYNFEEIENGARVRLSTKNPEALKAIHEFMRFQIEDHQTGDTTEIGKI